MLVKNQKKLPDDQKQKLQEMITNANQKSFLVKKQKKKEAIASIYIALGILIFHLATSVIVYFVANEYYYQKIYAPFEQLQTRWTYSNSDFDYLAQGAAEDLAAGKALTVTIIYFLFAPIIVIIPLVWALSKRKRNSAGSVPTITTSDG